MHTRGSLTPENTGVESAVFSRFVRRGQTAACALDDTIWRVPNGPLEQLMGFDAEIRRRSGRWISNNGRAPVFDRPNLIFYFWIYRPDQPCSRVTRRATHPHSHRRFVYRQLSLSFDLSFAEVFFESQTVRLACCSPPRYLFVVYFLWFRVTVPNDKDIDYLWGTGDFGF